MAEKEFLQICSLLKSKNISFEHIVHEHVHRSEEAAKIRGNRIEQAAKAIVLKVRPKKSKEYEFIQCVISGDKKIDIKKLKLLFNFESACLASPDEVLDKTGCTIGSVPPFGPLFGLKIFAEESVGKQEYIFFSAGTHNDSIKMKSKDFLGVMNLETISFSLDSV